MKGYEPVEGDDYVVESEQRGLLDDGTSADLPLPTSTAPSRRDTASSLKLGLSFAAGVIFCALAQYSFPTLCMGIPSRPVAAVAAQDKSILGSTVSHAYPPPSPTNNIPSYFPTDVGYPGPTPTGAEAAVVATAPQYPIHTGAPNLLGPNKYAPGSTHNESFDIFRYWGNLR